MFPLKCTVRKCNHSLSEFDNSLRCENGHCFDRTKYGYWSLLQPQDKKSSEPGDRDEAVLARQRWIRLGHMSEFVGLLAGWIENYVDIDHVIDLGCGEGSFGKALFQEASQAFCGVDLSRRAVRLAARQWPEANWILANADRQIPAMDKSVSCVMSLFGRRPISEIVRTLKPNGVCIVAVPGQNDFVEIRKRVQSSGTQRNRMLEIVSQFEQQQLTLIERTSWQQQATLDNAALTDAMMMTYRAVRNSQASELAGIEELDVTVAADVAIFQKQ